MKRLYQAKREEVYNAPIIPWNNGTYTPISNKQIMDLVETKVHDLGLSVRSEEYKVATTDKGLIKGVIGAYNITTDNGEFCQRVMFRNSYDKSMSFAFVCGLLVMICENGCISGDYQYKRVHRGVLENNTSTTEKDVIVNINDGFKMLESSFEQNTKQLNSLKEIEISPEESFSILGELFFTQAVISITQMSIIKKEFEHSRNFRHLGDPKFTGYDLYNHITEALKLSHPSDYIHNHVATHRLFEETFNI